MSVCRSWHNLITSPHFTERHHRRWNHRERIVFIPFTFEDTVKYQSLDNRTADHNLDKFLRNFAGQSWLPSSNHDKEFFYYEILDSCDGLLLVHIVSCHIEDPRFGLKEDLLVCNPVSGLCKLLFLPTEENVLLYCIGCLVYVSSIKRYKVLWARASELGCDLECYLIDVDPSQHQVTPWRKLGLTLGPLQATASREGKIHWLISAGQDSGDLKLVTLDVATEKFKITGCPSLPFNPHYVCPLYTGSNGKFYHVRSLVGLGEAEVWELELWYLKWLNDNPTWFSHKFTMSPPPTRPPYIDFINFIGELEEDKKFVLECRDTFVVYDMTWGRCTDTLPQDSFIYFHNVLPPIVHANSLLSYARES